MKQGQAQSGWLTKAVAGAPLAIELRHLRYFVALADAGSFTHAAEQMFIAQPTLSQQIRRLEEIVGTQLLPRRREGLQLTKAGTVLLYASRIVLSLVDHEVPRTRQSPGLGRPLLRAVVPPRLPDALATAAAPTPRSADAGASASAAVGLRLRRRRRPADGGADRPPRHRGKPPRADPAAPADGRPGPGPGRARGPAAVRDGRPGVERRPAPPAPANPLRRRGRHRLSESAQHAEQEPRCQPVGRGESI